MLLSYEWALVVSGLISIIFGIVLVSNPGEGALAMVVVIGAFGGPAVSDIEHAFAQVWALVGEAISDDEVVERESLTHLIATWATLTGILKVAAAIRLRRGAFAITIGIFLVVVAFRLRRWVARPVEQPSL